MRCLQQISILLMLIIAVNSALLDADFEDSMDEPISMKNESLAGNFTTTMMTSTIRSSSSPSLKKLFSVKHTSSRKLKPSNFSRKRSSTSSSTITTITTTTIPQTSSSLPPYALANSIVEQFNKYRDIDIISRIKQCDPKMKLQDMCESYSVDNHSYSLIRESAAEFQSLKQLYDALIDRMTVRKLSQSCSINQWCLANLTNDDFRFTLNVLRQRGRSLCTLERCAYRLSVHTISCPLISPKNISTPTLKLLPMLCALYNEQQNWDTPECMNDIVYLLHTLYAFWPKLERCHQDITDGSSGGCQPECLMFDDIFHDVESRCNQIGSILARVPALAWYRLINLKQICRYQGNSSKSLFIASVQDFISSNLSWYRLHQRPVYAMLFIIVIICLVTSFSLCLYFMSKNDSSSRRLDDDYEYTRLHDSTFDFGSNADNADDNSMSTKINNESQFDFTNHRRISEHQRLL